MKKVFLSLVVLIHFFSATGQYIHKEDRHTIVFRFNKLNIIISNQCKIDPLLNSPSSHMQFPFPAKGFDVFGYYMKIAVTENTDPFVNSFQPTRTIIDTSIADGQQMRAEDIEVRGSWRGISPVGWRDLKKYSQEINPDSYPFSEDSILRNAVYYMLSNGVTSKDTAANILIFRNKRTKQELLRLNIFGVDRPILPILGGWVQDTSYTLKDIGLAKNGRKYFGILPSEANMKELEREQSGLEMKNEKIQNSVLSLYFHGSVELHKDSVLEYRLRCKLIGDTSWHKSDHRILLTRLQHGEDYILQVRYIMHPTYIQEYTFSVEPLWYQTAKFKMYILLGCICIVFILILRNYRERAKAARRKKDQLALELKAIRAQLNPHFVFNALGSIQGLINKNDIVNANSYLVAFSSLLRESMANNDREMIPLGNELKLLETYIKLEQLRFHFQYEIIVDDALDKNAVEIPSLLLQPLIENAIKHGIAGLNENGFIKITFTAIGNILGITIQDNGIGFQLNTERKGFGLELTKKRIELLNKTLKKQPVTLDIESLKNTGTTVHLTFKNWL